MSPPPYNGVYGMIFEGKMRKIIFVAKFAQSGKSHTTPLCVIGSGQPNSYLWLTYFLIKMIFFLWARVPYECIIALSLLRTKPFNSPLKLQCCV